MQFGPQLIEGKTKVIYAHPHDATLVLFQHKDGITAGDGVRRNSITGKGALAGRTTANVFMLLQRAGVPTHFVSAPEPTVTVVRRCDMIPLEVVTRRLATGSYLKRHPQVAEGTRFDPTLVEFFLKDDARHDPQISEDEIVHKSLATAAEIAWMITTARQVFALLEQAWNSHNVTLVDLKIEYGRPAVQANEPASELLVADVIDNDSWRIWPGGEKGLMLDKQVYRDARLVDTAVLDEIYRRYAVVADLTDAFAAMM